MLTYYACACLHRHVSQRIPQQDIWHYYYYNYYYYHDCIHEPIELISRHVLVLNARAEPTLPLGSGPIWFDNTRTYSYACYTQTAEQSVCAYINLPRYLGQDKVYNMHESHEYENEYIHIIYAFMGFHCIRMP